MTLAFSLHHTSPSNNIHSCLILLTQWCHLCLVLHFTPHHNIRSSPAATSVAIISKYTFFSTSPAPATATTTKHYYLRPTQRVRASAAKTQSQQEAASRQQQEYYQPVEIYHENLQELTRAHREAYPPNSQQHSQSQGSVRLLGNV